MAFPVLSIFHEKRCFSLPEGCSFSPKEARRKNAFSRWPPDDEEQSTFSTFNTSL
jgi:hypothetical protein